DRRQREEVHRYDAALFLVATETAEVERSLIPMERLALRPWNHGRANVDRVEGWLEHTRFGQILHDLRHGDRPLIGPRNFVVDEALIGIEAVLVDQDGRPHELRRP